MMRSVAFVVLLAACTKTDTTSLERRVGALEDAAPTPTMKRWYCVYDPVDAEQGRCYDAEWMCVTAAAGQFGACLSTSVVWCAGDSCYLTSRICEQIRGPSACSGRSGPRPRMY